MNKILRILILSDLFIMSGFGLIQPIFAVFIIKNISDGTIASVGIAATVQLFSKALFQIMITRWTDAERGNCRELYTLIAGSVLISLTPLLYIAAQSMAHIYITQFVYGIGMALSYPSWRVIFTRYTTPDHAGYAWGVYDTVVSFGIAATAALGGFLAERYSFTHLFMVVFFTSVVGTFFLTHIFQSEFSCRINLLNKKQRPHDHRRGVHGKK